MNREPYELLILGCSCNPSRGVAGRRNALGSRASCAAQCVFSLRVELLSHLTELQHHRALVLIVIRGAIARGPVILTCCVAVSLL
jgi:hypothetical protein